MELRKVSVEDIFPDEKNPRKEFGDIDALAASFELNEMNPGEPINPPVVVQDGGIYRIVDGERRYRAIKKNKLSQCNVVVCDDISEASAMIAMLATDDKVQLSDIEKSRGVQQMLLLGVDPAKVEKTARLKAGDAMRINKAMLKIDDAAEDMTLDRLYAIAEFADDPEAVEELSNCSENEWAMKAFRYRGIKEKAANKIAMEELLNKCGIDIIADKDGTTMKGYAKNADLLAQRIGVYNVSESLVAWYDERDGSYELRVPAENKDEHIDAEVAALNLRVEALEKAVEQGDQARIDWFCERIGLYSTMQNVMDIVTARIKEEIWDEIEETFGEEFVGYEKITTINPSLAAFGYCKAAPYFYANNVITLFKGETIRGWYRDTLSAWKTWIDAFIADGFEPSPQEQEFITLCEAALANQEEEADDDSQN